MTDEEVTTISDNLYALISLPLDTDEEYYLFNEQRILFMDVTVSIIIKYAKVNDIEQASIILEFCRKKIEQIHSRLQIDIITSDENDEEIENNKSILLETRTLYMDLWNELFHKLKNDKLYLSIREFHNNTLSDIPNNTQSDIPKEGKTKLIWNGQKNQLYSVLRQLKEDRGLIGNSIESLAEFLIQNVTGFEATKKNTIETEYKRNKLIRKDKRIKIDPGEAEEKK